MSSGSNVEAGSYIVPLLVPRDTYALFFELIAKELMAKGVPSVEAGREYIIAPTVVRALGNGDLEAGHRLLDQFVREVRRKQVDSLKNPSYHDYILAEVDPEREAESLRETRRRAKETYGFSDDELDAVYGLRSRPK